ncbi:MAG: hypothetical protein IJ991_11015, partial [Thermoguttaceae bacterium]|nr:hypothetical protein [Thermoguttaceae bacterium]
MTTFPASRRGGIVYCPRCQQALIVPDIPTTDDGQDGENGEFAQDSASTATAFFSETGRNEDVAANGER